jgi:hypothetical protein
MCYCLGVANDAFNDMIVVTSCCSDMLLICAAQHRSFESLGTVVASYEWATGRRCTVAALQPPLFTRLAGAWCLFVVRRLRRCAHSPKHDHDGHAQGISVTLIARRPLGLQGTRGGPGAAPGWAAGAEAA